MYLNTKPLENHQNWFDIRPVVGNSFPLTARTGPRFGPIRALNVDLANQEVPQREKGNTYNHANGYIPDKAPQISTLQHHQRLLGEGGKSRKAAAETHGQKECPITALGAILAEYAPKKADKKATDEVHCQCCPRKPLADAFHGQ